MGAMQRLLHMIYPPLCVCCGAVLSSDGALCPACWRETPFLTGLVCEGCGAPLPGQAEAGPAPRCDTCLRAPPPWLQGRAALLYRDNGWRMVLALKHGGRTELARAAGPWLARAAAPLMSPDTLIVPVPLHRLRLLRRRFNQAALLAAALGAQGGHAVCPDALRRVRATPSLDGKGRAAREAAVSGAIAVHPRRVRHVRDRPVLLVDDVMTSGATFRAATEALLGAGAGRVRVLSLARVAFDT